MLQYAHDPRLHPIFHSTRAEQSLWRVSEAFEIAKLQSKKGMIQKLLRHKDPRWTWKLMCNRWPEEFRDRVATEICGPNGVSLMPQNPFKVEIRLADSEEIQTDFEVEQPDGSIS